MASQLYRQVVAGYVRHTDSYGWVVTLILVDYVAVSTLIGSGWGRVSTILLVGATLLFALRTSRARRIWRLLATLYMAASMLLALGSLAVPGAHDYSPQTLVAAGVLLLVTPVAILRHIITHPVVSTETVLGAVCVYLLIGFSFAFVYVAIGYLSATPFFGGQTSATVNDFLFFSYSTLTTVGYGNLVPVSSVGQTFAMLEALLGQVYLVIVVARLVSLWGQANPRAATRRAMGTSTDIEQHDADQHAPEASTDVHDSQTERH
jgi:hypothetical protein